MRAPGTPWDGRWLVVAMLLAYYAALGLSGPAKELPARWHLAGVHALSVSFADLQLFPATRSTLAEGGELYGANVRDPLHRPYNYPRVWLAFMRFPATPGWLLGIGVALAAAAVASVLCFWGRLAPAEGMLGGLLLCSAAFQQGVERGNTDLVILTLLVGGIFLAGEARLSRLAAAVCWGAAMLKLYPVLAFGGWFDGSARTWWRRTWLPLALFAVYLAATWRDLVPILKNTGGGWVISYGSEVLAAALVQVQAFHGENWTGGLPVAGVGRGLAAVAVGWILLRGWLKPGERQDGAAPESAAAGRRALLGFRIGALVFLGTFVAGSSFDYRQCFLLLTLPQLLVWRRQGRRLAVTALWTLPFSMCFNYLLAGWPGFFLNESAGWLLLLVLAALLATTWHRGGSAGEACAGR